MDTIDRYVAAMERHDLAAILELFGDSATVVHPVYGTLPAGEFFPRLMTDTRSDRMAERIVFQARERPDVAALYFQDAWTAADGQAFQSAIVLIFELQADGLVRKLTVVFNAP